jgi:hypothetical protein
MSKRPHGDDDDAETSVLAALNERIAALPRTEAETDALYAEYVKACEEAGLKPNPPRRSK